MGLKLVSYKIEETTNEKIKKICEQKNIKQSDFINHAIETEIVMRTSPVYLWELFNEILKSFYCHQKIRFNLENESSKSSDDVILHGKLTVEW